MTDAPFLSRVKLYGRIEKKDRSSLNSRWYIWTSPQCQLVCFNFELHSNRGKKSGQAWGPPVTEKSNGQQQPHNGSGTTNWHGILRVHTQGEMWSQTNPKAMNSRLGCANSFGSHIWNCFVLGVPFWLWCCSCVSWTQFAGCWFRNFNITNKTSFVCHHLLQVKKENVQDRQCLLVEPCPSSQGKDS